MRRLRKLVRLLVELGRSLGRSPAGTTADVVVDPTDRSRRFLLLAHLLSGIGVNLRVRWSLRQFLALNDKGYKAFSSPRVRLGAGPLQGELLVADEGTVLPFRDEAKVLWVRYEARACPDPLPPRSTFVPLLFHPGLMTQQSFDQARRLSENRDRSLGAFFAGNWDPRSYDNPVFAREYGMLNRYEVIQVLREPEFAGWLYEPASFAEMETERLAGNLRSRFTLVNGHVAPVPQSRWLELLGESRYFLAPPGYTQPFSHNLIESMSVGAVPITGYGHLLRPRLNDGSEMLAYSDRESLRAVLRRLMANQIPDWAAQSRAARDYQQTNLSPQALEGTLSAFIAEPSSTEWTLILSGALP